MLVGACGEGRHASCSMSRREAEGALWAGCAEHDDDLRIQHTVRGRRARRGSNLAMEAALSGGARLQCRGSNAGLQHDAGQEGGRDRAEHHEARTGTPGRIRARRTRTAKASREGAPLPWGLPCRAARQAAMHGERLESAYRDETSRSRRVTALSATPRRDLPPGPRNESAAGAWEVCIAT